MNSQEQGFGINAIRKRKALQALQDPNYETQKKVW